MELVSIIIGVAGFSFGLYSFFKNRKVKELTVVYSNQLIEGQQKSGVEILYLDEPVSDFIRYQVTLINSGGGELRPRDFEEPVKLAFESLYIVSQTAIFASPAAKPEYQVNAQDIEINFDVLKRNEHVTFEVLTGAHRSDLVAPTLDTTLLTGKPIQVHQQAFEADQSDRKYQILTKHFGVLAAAFVTGFVLLGLSFYSKYQAFIEGQALPVKQLINELLSVNSWLWFGIFLVALVLVIFAYESSKVLSPKFKRYKFEQLIQNK